MKQIIRILFITLLVIPLLTISKIQATPGGPRSRGSGFTPMPTGRFGQREGFRSPFDDPFRQPESHGRARGWDDRGDGNDGQGDGNRAPLDGGLSLLLAAGIGLGVKKAAQRKKAAAADEAAAGEIGEAK